ncbi:MAG TPA: SbcC/MukB-like Walker B domain-containing protein [Anaerolineales bacterium]
MGAAVEEILARLEKARLRAEDVRNQVRQNQDERTRLLVRVAVAMKDIERRAEDLKRTTDEREMAIASLRKIAATRLLSVAVPESDDGEPSGWSVTRAVEVARAIEAALAQVDIEDAAWERNQRGIHQHIQQLNETLRPYQYDPVTTMEDDILVVTVPYQGRSCTMAELRSALSDEVANRQALLNAREREVIENHLIGEVATHLHDRLHHAEGLVRDMNAELMARPTSSGMTLRFIWEPIEDDGSAGLADARKRLLGAGGTWSPAEREALGAFLQQQIQAVRAANEGGTWPEHLAKALDYRAWHRFIVERQQDGQWKRLTRRTHGTGSGGEKAFMLTIPLFAAAAAHYRSADRLAPRPILLDEAFAGIDRPSRGECMGLLRAFDLDFVMTSEHEWGCYATLPGVAIYHLSARPGIDAVGVTRWVWNGKQRIRDHQELPTPYPPATLTQRESAGENGNGRGKL